MNEKQETWDFSDSDGSFQRPPMESKTAPIYRENLFDFPIASEYASPSSTTGEFSSANVKEDEEEISHRAKSLSESDYQKPLQPDVRKGRFSIMDSNTSLNSMERTQSPKPVESPETTTPMSTCNFLVF